MTLKSWAFGVGLAAAIFGMALEQRWLVWVAVGLLAVAFLLRFFTRPPETDEP
jgi:Zn-dependent membrane protease YugP